MKQLVAICGKSASGKDTILSRLVELYPNDFHRKVSCTTREKRPNEIEGADYYFKTGQEFFNLVAKNKMLEATDFNGSVYGTSIESLKDDIVNIGIFDLEGIEILSIEKDIGMAVFYIDAEDHIRIVRSLQSGREQTVDDVYKRFVHDRQVFDGVEDFPDIMILENNDRDIDDLVTIIKMISDELFSE